MTVLSPRIKKSCSIRDVADYVRVSAGTVSRMRNSRPGVRISEQEIKQSEKDVRQSAEQISNKFK